MMRAAYRQIDGSLSFHEDIGEGQPVLCIHTAGQGGVQWRHVGAALAARGYRVIVPDLPGHGRSELPRSGAVQNLVDYAAWCGRLIDELELERPYVVGCSIGGKIAIELACSRGATLSGAIAMAADAGMAKGAGERMSRGLVRELEDSAAASRSDRTYFGTLAVVGRKVPEERRRLIADMHRREDPIVSNSDLIGWASFDAWSRLRSARCPVHMVAGDDDLWIDADAVKRTAAAMPQARFTLLDGIGHYPMEEMEGFDELLDRWLKELSTIPRKEDA
ncbi:alpha/beta hydrolase [Rhizobium sp. AN80A]|uniref:alpha/beta fold hydrolase n=1 Tax=Rhizobium sp. AN80A TaxID=3040673 RepID=UPI0024B37EC8|nr:alpha/beta hydrolase [Rhizobium sp. AN80A]